MSDKPHILIVDDEEDIREPVGTYLEMNGFSIALAASADEAIATARNARPDLAILDIMIGEDDGILLCRDLQKLAEIPVMFLSGKSEDTERIIGLEVGADDYIIKPFNPRELLARVKAVLRRAANTTQDRTSDQITMMPLYAFGPWTLNTAQHEIKHKNGDLIELSSGETKLLHAFVKNPHAVMSRDQLMDMTHGRQADVFDRSIDNSIARLRKKIEENPRTPKLLKTYWGGGYALNCDVQVC